MISFPSFHEVFDSAQGIVIIGALVFAFYDRLKMGPQLKAEIEKLNDTMLKLATAVSNLSERVAANEAAFEIYTQIKK